MDTPLNELIKWMDNNKGHCTYGTIRGKATELLGIERMRIVDAFNTGHWNSEDWQEPHDGSKYFTDNFTNQ